MSSFPFLWTAPFSSASICAASRFVFDNLAIPQRPLVWCACRKYFINDSYRSSVPSRERGLLAQVPGLSSAGTHLHSFLTAPLVVLPLFNKFSCRGIFLISRSLHFHHLLPSRRSSPCPSPSLIQDRYPSHLALLRRRGVQSSTSTELQTKPRPRQRRRRCEAFYVSPQPELAYDSDLSPRHELQLDLVPPTPPPPQQPSARIMRRHRHPSPVVSLPANPGPSLAATPPPHHATTRPHTTPSAYRNPHRHDTPGVACVGHDLRPVSRSVRWRGGHGWKRFRIHGCGTFVCLCFCSGHGF
ncbi:hypothetical protein MSAN_01807100 [Mycena sanguinolenta]|uniref:Uncharacterized protein n=1 Tax=Mycena sanguinolenta TaxID=230812 RepID=A0A8H7CTB4_9AGAR|nr:hypothetical protein MSAN_01807100 [Mycena sanguinolenta]